MTDSTTYVYRMYDKESNLLYVGITKNMQSRYQAHRAHQPWFSEVHTFAVQEFPSRTLAEEEELRSIQNDNPKYNEMPGVRSETSAVLERYRPKTFKRLPQEEIDYLITLNTEETYIRCAELLQAGWSMTAILEGAKVTPTSTQLRAATRQIFNPDSGRPLPPLPRTRVDTHREHQEKLKKEPTSKQKERLKELASYSKKYRPYLSVGHPIYEAVQEYRELIWELYSSGILVRKIAKAAGVDESQIRKRIREHKAERGLS